MRLGSNGGGQNARTTGGPGILPEAVFHAESR